MLFSAGGLFALYEGVEKIRHPHALEDPVVAVIVLVVAIGLEGYSLRTAIHESLPHKGGDSWFGFIRHAKVPELPAVLLEDVAALTGLVFALLGVGLPRLTGDPVWDGIGTCAIGVLLITVAVVLVVETKSLLLGEAAAPVAGARDRGRARRPRRRPGHPPAHHAPRPGRGAGRGEDRDAGRATVLTDVARAIDAAEARVRAAVPAARVIYLEPDLDRSTSAPERVEHD